MDGRTVAATQPTGDAVVVLDTAAGRHPSSGIRQAETVKRSVREGRAVARIATMLPVDWPASRIIELARASVAGGVDELWVAEDLGLQGGVALAAHLLAVVPGVPVGLGIAPAAARHPAFLAMQAATLGQLHPGRFRLGIGHGMPNWMRQLGIWPSSPVGRLETTLRTVRELLAGERVQVDRDGVVADEVALATAPVDVPLYGGVRGPRSLQAVAPLVDGVVLAGWSGPVYTRWAREQMALTSSATPQIVVSARLAFDPRYPDRAVKRLSDQLQRDASRGALREQLGPLGLAVGEAALLTEVGIAGELDAVTAGIRRWADAGADVVLLDPLTPDDLDRLLVAGIPGLDPAAV
jgi:5,10-methylenetetrahydromethanopterin reductase